MALALLACRTPAQSGKAAPTPGDSIYTYKTRSADGIGKYYMGREIAYYMSHRAADWLDRPEREAEERPSLLLASLNLRPTDVVADIGAGSGYYSLRIAPMVPQGKVLATDIQPEMLDIIRRKQAEQQITNIETILSTETDPMLPPGSVDVVLLVDVYHELAYPKELMQAVVRALKPGGRVLLVEFRAEDKKVPIKELHKMSEAQARREMEAAGLIFRENKTILPWQHCLVFEKGT